MLDVKRRTDPGYPVCVGRGSVKLLWGYAEGKGAKDHQGECIMDNIFIGWSGNQSLARALGDEIDKNKNYKAIVGGGTPTNMYIGAQVIEQIKDSDYALLLMEKKDGAISPNLMFEFGYILAKMPVNRIFLVLINMEDAELASDIRGTWVFKTKKFDRSVTGEAEFAHELYVDFVEFENSRMLFGHSNYFDYIDRWEECFASLKTDIRISTNDSEYIIFGCLAAYYYNDYQELYDYLDDIKYDEGVSDIIYFAKAYISVFLNSGNMRNPINDDEMMTCREAFETLLERERVLSPKLDAVIDILVYNAYGLASMLYLRNEDLDEDEREYFERMCEEHCLGMLELVNEYYDKYGDDNKVLVNLFKAYIYNDLAKFYLQKNEDEKHFLFLDRSVKSRKELFKEVQLLYPQNRYLVEKMEQEYYIALANQCRYMKDAVLKKMTVKKIKKRLDEWIDNYDAIRSMLDRIQANLDAVDE